MRNKLDLLIQTPRHAAQNRRETCLRVQYLALGAALVFLLVSLDGGPKYWAHAIWLGGVALLFGAIKPKKEDCY